MFTVVIAEKEGAERRVTFTEAEVTIGRVPGNDVVLPKGNVSKRHSRIVLKDNRFIVVDLKSTNGTYVNGRKITSPLVVKEGDKIYVGDYVLTLEGVAPALDALKPPSMVGGPGGIGSMAGVSKATQSDADPAPSINGVGDHDDDDDELPAVLRGTMAQSSMPVPTVAEEGLPDALGGDDDEQAVEDEHLLPAESELEVFEDRSSREQERPPDSDVHVAQQFPPPMQDDQPARASRSSLMVMPETSGENVLGPLDHVLSDPQVFHVVVERFDRIRADRGQGLTLEQASFGSPEALVATAEEILSQAGLPLGTASYDVSLPSGLQVVALLAGAASNGAVLSIRRRPSRVETLSELVEEQLLTQAIADKVTETLRNKRHLWLVAPSGVDVSSFFASALQSCPESERLALFERAPEVALGERSAVCIKLGSVPVSELLERVRSFRPSRLALYDLRESDLSAVLDAFAHHADGNLASFAARSAKDALAAFARTGGPDLTLRAASLVIELKRGEGKPQVTAAYDVELDGSGDLTLRAI